ncbi:MAG: hypothetical protein JWN81_373 [Solirubrobacterales bacterium]|nr:hypothetical protein [Solirubrobacterales bacterium]
MTPRSAATSSDVRRPPGGLLFSGGTSVECAGMGNSWSSVSGMGAASGLAGSHAPCPARVNLNAMTLRLRAGPNRSPRLTTTRRAAHQDSRRWQRLRLPGGARASMRIAEIETPALLGDLHRRRRSGLSRPQERRASRCATHPATIRLVELRVAAGSDHAVRLRHPTSRRANCCRRPRAQATELDYRRVEARGRGTA